MQLFAAAVLGDMSGCRSQLGSPFRSHSVVSKRFHDVNFCFGLCSYISAGVKSARHDNDIYFTLSPSDVISYCI